MDQYISDLVGEEYKNWQIADESGKGFGDFILFDADTGSGKTYFILYVLAPYAKSKGARILYLANRTKLIDEVERKIEENRITNIITLTYQRFDMYLATGHDFLETLGDYKYIVFDEAHYFVQDADMNRNTHYSYDFMCELHRQFIKIIISATADYVFSGLLQCNDEKNYYELRCDKSYIKEIIFFTDTRRKADKSDDYPLKVIRNILQETDSKILYFVRDKKRIAELCEDPLIKENSNRLFNKTDNDDVDLLLTEDYYEESDGKETFKERLLLTTTKLDNGISFKDKDIEYVFCDLWNTYEVIQCLGRKRPVNGDQCTFFLRKPYISEIQYLQKILNEKIEKADMYRYNKNEFVQKYWRDNNEEFLSIQWDKNQQDDICKLNGPLFRKWEIDKEICDSILNKGYKKTFFDMYEYTGDTFEAILVSEPDEFFVDFQRLKSFLKRHEGKAFKAIGSIADNIKLITGKKKINEINLVIENELLEYVLTEKRSRDEAEDNIKGNQATLWYVNVK